MQDSGKSGGQGWGKRDERPGRAGSVAPVRALLLRAQPGASPEHCAGMKWLRAGEAVRVDCAGRNGSSEEVTFELSLNRPCFYLL